MGVCIPETIQIYKDYAGRGLLWNVQAATSVYGNSTGYMGSMFLIVYYNLLRRKVWFADEVIAGESYSTWVVHKTFMFFIAGTSRTSPLCNRRLDITKPPCLTCLDSAFGVQWQDLSISIGYHRSSRGTYVRLAYHSLTDTYIVSHRCYNGKCISTDAWGVWYHR